ncbi:hypothetical protein ISF_02677 [Cordyceps fumosorosea ARSEF 2679]|uniref:Uncharacterized protein n=1 Tax=Cordyceps fumosorosea (strain ARSEF 2679) TaxID=1081104 RepID=A0A168BY95_CORFA|nr:hypothetical protein ISF_02677 [Cordyceps fumosorosea ARSEF 2679]OAA70703.1 hypothetical protein ISF_02677 [Cordyceps fumosorosea ARSEF 2679]
MSTEDSDKRAQELNDALLGVPGYADDTMFFVARYGHRLQCTLRKADFDTVTQTTTELSIAMSKPNNQARVSELRAQIMEILRPFPELAQDYDRFAASARSTAASFGARRK